MPNDLVLAVALGLTITAVLWVAIQYAPSSDPSGRQTPLEILATLAEPGGPCPLTLIRAYHCQQQADTTAAFQAD